LLTLGAMVFSNTLLSVMISFQFGMYDLMIENTLAVLTGHIQVQSSDYNDDKKMRQSIADALPLASQIREQLGIDSVSVRGQAFALASSEERSFGLLVMGVQPEFEGNVSTLPGLVTEGRYLEGLNSNDAVIGSVLARNLRVGTGDEITLVGTGRDGSFSAAIVNVVGIIQSGLADLDRSIAQIPLGTFQETFSMGGHAHQIVIKTADLSATLTTKHQVRSMLPSDRDLVVHDWDVLQPGLKQSIQADLFSAWFMYGVLIALVAFSVLNTVFMSVLERTREFGIIMSLGVTPWRIGRLVMLETAVMGVLGLIAGVSLGAILIGWAGAHGISFPGMEEMGQRFNIPSRLYPQLNLFKLSLGPMIVFMATLIAATWPAVRLHWLHPVQAMRAA
jgi:ABC-type lipoprotein release transport system permease subunit